MQNASSFNDVIRSDHALEFINAFVLRSQALARGGLHLCGLIQKGNSPAVSVSILAQYLALSETATRNCFRSSDWADRR
jgi:hypothetical protein